jgi:serine/threonine protein kinase
VVLADVLAWARIASYKPLMTQLLKPGLTIADYEIIELVGQGGMGEVYRAKQLSMDRIVAIKTLAPHLARKDPIFAKRFVEEARAAGRLNHANIVAVHDVDLVTIETPEGPHEVDFFSMEFIAGESVKDVIERDGACKLSLVELVMRGMAEALIYAESQRVIHRDIKPDNIMITNAGEVKLADLGLAVQAGDDSVSEERDERGRAKVMGTPLYMSPEQARALPLDPRSDQYSLGATLFHVFSPVPDPAALRPELSEGWCRLCCRLMAKKPEERFLDASDMKRVIEAVIAGRDEEIDQQPQQETPPEAKKK